MQTPSGSFQNYSVTLKFLRFPSVALLSLIIYHCSVFKVHVEGVPSKLNNVRTQVEESDLGCLPGLVTEHVSLERR